MELTILGLQSLLSMLSLEGLKQLAYKLFPGFNLDPKYYTLILPVLGLLTLPVASWLAGGPLDFSLWTEDTVRQTILLVFTSLAAMLGYNGALKPLKNASATFTSAQG